MFGRAGASPSPPPSAVWAISSPGRGGASEGSGGAAPAPTPTPTAPSSSSAASSTASGTGGAAGSAGSASSVATPSGLALVRLRRIVRELQQLHANPNAEYEVFPTRENLGVWKVLVSGPDGTPYGGGVWCLLVEFPDTFPTAAPTVRFVNAIKHCNVNAYGKICHPIFDREWTADTSMKTVLDTVYGLLLNPDRGDPIDTTLAQQFLDGDGRYEVSITTHTARHANRTKEAWRAELLHTTP